MTGLSKEQIVDLLINVLQSPKVMQWKGNKIQFCCTIHGESHPSAGINIDYVPEDSSQHYQVFHCFSCAESGTIPWLVYKSLPDRFRSVADAEKFLEERYHVKFNHLEFDGFNIKRYEEFFGEKENRFELPITKLAIFKSGKQTYQYFFNRGFDKNDMGEYMIGRDIDEKTVTIPIFWEDKKLAGIIGRYIDPRRPKNMRYKVYNFPKSGIIFPLDKIESTDTIIGVESVFDAMLLRKWGYNAIAIMGDSMSNKQAEQILERCDRFIDLFDNDNGGLTARESAKKKLRGIMYLTPNYYPNYGKDPTEWGRKETEKIIASAGITRHELPRFVV